MNANEIVIGIWILFVFLTGSCNKKVDLPPHNVILVASTVGSYEILNLSDYVTEIRYIPLESNDSALISPINLKIIYENGKILILDNTTDSKNNCYLFNNDGEFCCKIGQWGQGPDNYLLITDVSIHENLIYLMAWYRILIYDTNGRIVENIHLQSDDMPVGFKESNLRSMIPLKKNVFIVNIVTNTRHYPTAFLFETNNSTVETIKEYPNSIKLDRLKPVFSTIESGVMYRYENEVRIYKPINDTIFTIDQNKEIKENFIFELGKYKPTLSYFEWKEGGNDLRAYINFGRNFIIPVTICESRHHLFIRFSFGNHTPEPYESFHLGQKIINNDVYSVFDKRTGELILMRQPIKGKLGFKNDFDNGPVIFPNYITSNNELVTFMQPEEFLEYYALVENPSVELKNIADKIDIYDNLIVIIAKLKD